MQVVVDEFPHVNRVVRYEFEGAEIEEVVEPALESRQFACRALPEGVESVSIISFLD